MAKQLKVFISSPGDVGQERLIAARVIERLSGEFSRYMEVIPYKWEMEPLRATSHFAEQIGLPSETDIVVFILWSRFGTKLPPEFRDEVTGEPYDSGTEFEFLDAYRSYQERKVPDLLVYRKMADPPVHSSKEEELRDMLAQREALNRFMDTWFGSPQEGFTAAFHTFKTPDEFEMILEEHLRKLIRSRVPEHVVETGVKRWYQNPFRGLEPFDYEHAPVFFGRTKAIGEVKDLLLAQEARGKPFVMVYGMSGCGKSSLVRAGVLPTITHPGVIDDVDFWRWCVFRPGDAPDGLIVGLVSALASDSGLPALASESALSATLVSDVEATGEIIRNALDTAAYKSIEGEATARVPRPRLVLVVDQMEELFSLTSISSAEREEFIAALSTLVACGSVWVIATMRSDYYHRSAEIPALVKLAEGGEYRLLKPDFGEIGQMIRMPAAAAGLKFEVDPETGRGLDDVLHEAATRDTASLPLLEFTLNELYNQRVRNDSEILSFEAYEKLGGLEGALAQRAEAVYTSLEPEVRSQFRPLFRSLIAMSPGDEKLSARRIPLREAAKDDLQESFLNAFIDARMIVVDRDNDGSSVVRIAHEALLHRWPRLKSIVEEDMDFLRVRGRVAAGAARWLNEEKNPDFLLQVGKPLLEAEELRAEYRDHLATDVLEYIDLSVKKAEKARKRRNLAVVTSFIVLTLFLVVTLFQLHQVRIQREAALRHEAHVLADLSLAESNRGAGMSGIHMALEALPRSVDSPERPFVREARRALLTGLYARYTKGSAVLSGHRDSVWAGAFSPDGRHVVTASQDNTLRIWDARAGTELFVLDRHRDVVVCASFCPDGSTILSASWDGSAYLWDSQTGEMICEFSGHRAQINHAEFSPDGDLVATVSSDGDAVIWSLRTAEPVSVLEHGVRVNAGSFSLDGRYFATVSDDGRASVWNPISGQLQHVFDRHGHVVDQLAMSPDGRLAATSSWDNVVYIWNLETGDVVHRLDYRARMPAIPERVIGVYAYDHRTGEDLLALEGSDLRLLTAAISGLEFSPTGTRLAVSFRYINDRVVDVGSGREIFALDQLAGDTVLSDWKHMSSMVFTPDGKHLITTENMGGETAREGDRLFFWCAEDGEELYALTSPVESPNSLVFSPDGSQFLVSSLDGPAVIFPYADGDIVFTDAYGVADLDFAPIHELETIAIVVAAGNTWRLREYREGLVRREYEYPTECREPRLHAYRFSGGYEIHYDLEDRSAVLHREEDGRVLMRFQPPFIEDVRFLNVCPEGEKLMTAHADGTIRIWDMASASLLLQLEKHMKDKLVTGGHFTADNRLVTTCLDTTARVWDVDTGAQLGVFTGHESGIRQATFTGDGEHVLTRCYDNTVILWDINTLQEILRFRAPGDIHRAGFSRDGDYIVALLESGVAVQARYFTDDQAIIDRGWAVWAE